MPPEVLFFVLTVLAFVAHWLARNFTPKWLGEWGPLAFNVIAAVFAIAASTTLAQQDWLTGALSWIAGLGSWGVGLLGVAALVVPWLIVLVLAPASWCKIGLTTVLLGVFLLAVPLQAHAFPGALGQASAGLTQLAADLTTQVTSGLIA